MDAPVSGTVPPARRGELQAFVGGSQEHFERARSEVLRHLCREVPNLTTLITFITPIALDHPHHLVILMTFKISAPQSSHSRRSTLMTLVTP